MKLPWSLVLAFVFAALIPRLQAAEPAILQLHMDRDVNEVHPQHDRLGFRVQINRPDGSPVHAASVNVRLQAPATPWLASTDFPVVEGTLLFHSTVQIDKGEFSFAFVPPIRGVYTLAVEVGPLPGDETFAPSQQQWETEIRENPAKQRNLAILLLALITVGGVSGYVFASGSFRPGVTVPGLILLVTGLLPAPRLEAHGSHEHKAEAVAEPAATSGEQGDRIEFQSPEGTPRVGELTQLKARFVTADGAPKPARFRLRFTQLEHGTEVFATELVAPDGILQWSGQFYDGSDHRVDIDAVPLSQTFDETKPAHSDRVIEVEAIAPPTKAVVKSFGLLMLVTAIALGFGIVLGRMFTPDEDYSI